MGCSTLVAFDVNQAIFTSESVTFGWQVELSRKRMAFLFSFFTFALNMFNHSSIVAVVIQAFLLYLQITWFSRTESLSFSLASMILSFSFSDAMYDFAMMKKIN
jgi:hypothetical protein